VTGGDEEDGCAPFVRPAAVAAFDGADAFASMSFVQCLNVLSFEGDMRQVLV